jgi:hypothetical protein
MAGIETLVSDNIYQAMITIGYTFGWYIEYLFWIF